MKCSNPLLEYLASDGTPDEDMVVIRHDTCCMETNAVQEKLEKAPSAPSDGKFPTGATLERQVSTLRDVSQCNSEERQSQPPEADPATGAMLDLSTHEGNGQGLHFSAALLSPLLGRMALHTRICEALPTEKPGRGPLAGTHNLYTPTVDLSSIRPNWKSRSDERRNSPKIIASSSSL